MKKVKCFLSVLISEHNAKVLGGGGEKLTQSRLAAETGLQPSAISRLCQNKVRQYDSGVIDKICDFFDCEVGDLLRRVDVTAND